MKDAVGIFFSMSTQWRWTSAGLAGALRMGLDYQAIEPVARMLGVDLTGDVFADLQLMETEALGVWSRKARG